MVGIFFCRIMECLCYTVPLWDQSGPARVYKHCLQVVLAGHPRRQDFIVWKQACIAQSNRLRAVDTAFCWPDSNWWTHNKQSLAPPPGPPEQWPPEDRELSAHHRGRAVLDAQSCSVSLCFQAPLSSCLSPSRKKVNFASCMFFQLLLFLKQKRRVTRYNLMSSYPISLSQKTHKST